MNIFKKKSSRALAAEDIRQIVDSESKLHDGYDCKALELDLKAGTSAAAIARKLGRHPLTIQKWVKILRESKGKE
jgi:IS30 family transposase